MTTDDGHQVTNWLSFLKAGDHCSAQPLWEVYFQRLFRLVRTQLPSGTSSDPEVLTASALKSFWLGAAGGRFPQLHDRHDLWKILVVIAGQKIADELERANALKRGGGMNRADVATLESVLCDEPTAEMAAMVAETFRNLLEQLSDDQYRQIAIWKVEGYTNEEISNRLGCAIRTVCNRLDVIRSVLRRGVEV